MSYNVSENKLEPSAPPQFVGKFQSVSVYQGDSLVLYCKAAGDSLQMIWSKDGQLITNDNANYK